MKSYLLSFLVLCISTKISSQNIQIKWGEEYIKKAGIISDIVKENDNFLWVIDGNLLSNKALWDKFHLIKISKNTWNPVQTHKIDLVDSKKTTAIFTDLKAVGNNFFLFRRRYIDSKPKDKFILDVKQYDENFVSKSKWIALDTLEVNNYTIDEKITPNEFSVIFSEDQSKFCVVNQASYGLGLNKKLSFKVFDQNLKQLEKIKGTTPFFDQLFQLGDVQLSNSGQVLITGKVWPGESLKNEDYSKEILLEMIQQQDNFQRKALVCSGNNNAIKELKIGSYDAKLQHINVKIRNATNQVDLSAFFSINFKNSINGFTEGSFDISTTKEIAKNEIKFSVEDMKNFERSFKNKELESRFVPMGSSRDYFTTKVLGVNMHVVGVISNSDGGKTLIAENRSHYSKSFSTDFGIKRSNHYLYNDIIILKIKADGKLAWNKIISKHYHAMDQPLGGSFIFAHKENKMLFIFHDYPNNKLDGSTLEQKNAVRDNTIMRCVVVDENGELKISEYAEIKNALFFPLISRGKELSEIGEHPLIFGGKKYSKCYWGQISW